MLIIIDKKIPGGAREKLKEYGTLLELSTKGLTYPAISGHPDIFFCKTPQILVCAPGLPSKYFKTLDSLSIPFIKGNLPTGILHPASVHYNAAASDVHLVHRLEYTDPVILQNCHYLKKIPVRQGYTRCNLLLLKEGHYITSDKGIHKALRENGLNGLSVSPEEIILPGFQNGAIGGAMGLFEDTIFIIGQLKFFREGDQIREYLSMLDYTVIELYEGPLYDGGSILVI